MRPFAAARPTLATLTAALALAGCSAPPSVEQPEVEERVADHLVEEFGVTPVDVTCPDQIRGEEGETMDCLADLGDVDTDVEVQVEEVTGDTADDVQLRFQVVDPPEDPPE